MQTRRSSYGLFSALILAIIALSFSSIFVTELERLGVAPLVVALYRVSIATAILLPFTIRRSLGEIRSIGKTELLLVTAAGGCLAIHFGCWISSLQYIPIAVSVLLVSSHPLFVVLAAGTILHEKPTPRAILGATVGVAGTGLICWTGLRGTSLEWQGDVLAIAGALAMAGYLLIGRKVRSKMTLLGYATPVYALCALFLLIWCVAAGSKLTGYGSKEWIYFGALAIIPTIMGHTVINWVIKHLSAPAISVALLGEPVVAGVLALVVFGQLPGWSAILGGTLVLTGIYLATQAKERIDIETESLASGG